MAIFIDSAIFKEVESAHSLGWVHGVTTNPALLAKADSDVLTNLTELAHLDMGPLFYQLISTTLDGMYKEMELAAKVVGSALVLKVFPSQHGLQFVSQCADFPCCVTSVYSAAQALVASEAGARFVAVYVNRATRFMGDGLQLVREVAEILKRSRTEIIAASIKSSEEACASLCAGAQHLTLPYEVIMSLIEHPLTDQTLVEFQAIGAGLISSPTV